MIETIPAPRDTADNKLYRALVLQWADTPDRQRRCRERCKADICWFIDTFGWQFNPDNRGREVEPFICFEFQAKVLTRTLRRLLELRMPVLWEKSRKLGASWMMIYIEIQQCIFHTRQKFLNLSHSEEAVNKPDDPDSLFWKMRLVLDYLPRWMCSAKRLKKSFWFYESRSSITSSATTERAGVGGRGVVMADEFSKHPKAYQVLGQTHDTGPQLFVGTHYGVGGAFYDLTLRPDMHKEVMHWTDHPDRRKGLYRSNPALPLGYEILDTDFEYGNQCSCCSGLVRVPEGEHTPCCEEKGVSRPYQFITDGKPTGGPHPGERSPYYDYECVKRGNERDVAMHLDINPQGSQSEYFSAIFLRKYIDRCCRPPVWVGELAIERDSGLPVKLVEREDGPIKLWRYPKNDIELPPGNYAGGADLSAGVGNTPSVFSAGDADTDEKVLEFATARMYPEDFALYVHGLCHLLRTSDGTACLLTWESNGPGNIFGKEVMGLGYRRVWYRAVQRMFAGVLTSSNAGWHNNPTAKRTLFDAYRTALYGYSLVNPSEPAVLECTLYRFSDKRDAIEHPRDVATDRPEEARSNHGDRPMADALMWMMMQELGAGRVRKLRQKEEAPPVGSLAYRRTKRHKAPAREAWNYW